MILRILICCSILPVFALGGDLLFIGSAESEGKGGVYVSEFAEGILTQPQCAFETPQKVAIELGQDGEILFVSQSKLEEDDEGKLIALRILENNELEEINRHFSGVDHFCSMAVSPDGRHLIGASFGLGIVKGFICQPNGGIGKPSGAVELPKFAKGKRMLARAHDVEFSPDSRFAFVADIANNRIYTFSLDPKTGALEELGFVNSDSFVGPRHLILNEKGTIVYVLCQRGSSVTAFRHDGEGQLTEFQTITTLPTDYAGPTNHSAEVLQHPTGKFLYASNRGANSLAVFQVGDDGTLTNQQIISSGGDAPWSFVLDSEGQHLICSNLKSNNLVVFDIDQKTGELKKTSEVTVPEPISLAIRKK